MKIEVCILAGGLSTRMGRDKARLCFGGRTMLSIVRAIAGELGFQIRVIRRDAVPRCGPLGGVITALRSTRADAVLFLACDMPLISGALLQRIIRASQADARSVFASREKVVGFPFLLPRSAIGSVSSQIGRRLFSLRQLAVALRARTVAFPKHSSEWVNVNAPRDAALVRQILAHHAKTKDASLVTRALHPYGSRHAKSADSSLPDGGPPRRQRRR
jgi:molybdopterin-guanine dinucleotide biosynthesis protein A